MRWKNERQKDILEFCRFTSAIGSLGSGLERANFFEEQQETGQEGPNQLSKKRCLHPTCCGQLSLKPWVLIWVSSIPSGSPDFVHNCSWVEVLCFWLLFSIWGEHLLFLSTSIFLLCKKRPLFFLAGPFLAHSQNAYLGGAYPTPSCRGENAGAKAGPMRASCDPGRRN